MAHFESWFYLLVLEFGNEACLTLPDVSARDEVTTQAFCLHICYTCWNLGMRLVRTHNFLTFDHSLLQVL